MNLTTMTSEQKYFWRTPPRDIDDEFNFFGVMAHISAFPEPEAKKIVFYLKFSIGHVAKNFALHPFFFFLLISPQFRTK